MADSEWRELQERLRTAKTPQEKADAAEAFRRYLEAKKAAGKGGSKPTLVNLSSKTKDYPNAVPLEDIPRVMVEKPEFFELMKRIAGK